MAHLGVGSPCQHINALKVVELDNDFNSPARLRGGAGRTRTNHQSVMECGRVRPAHLVEHRHSSSKNFAIEGHFHKSGNLRLRGNTWWAGRTRTSNQAGVEGGSSRPAHHPVACNL